MSEKDRYTFAAVITVSLPDKGGETSIEVVLTPTDKMETGDGTTKLLQDCTLAELVQFADILEKELWEDYLNIPLMDLALSDEAGVTVYIPEHNSEGVSDANIWMEHLVVLQGDEGGDSGDLPNHLSSQKDSPESSEVSELELGQFESAEEAAEDAAADSGDNSITADIDQQVGEGPREDTLEEALEAIDFTVAEPEQIHEEVVAQEEIEEPPPPPTPAEMRILGRRRPINHPTWTAADILINEPAFRDAQAHAISCLDREVAGILVGPTPEKQPDGRYIVHISDVIIAKYTRMHGASVTYTPESWRYVNDRLNELYPDDAAVIVGWYHTHPGFGIFLSGMDRFIHQNFFTQKWHVAFVLDPIARRSGFFCWDRKQDKVDPYEFPWPQWAANSW